MSGPADRAAAYRILREALELNTGERAAFVADRCGGSRALEMLVSDLLTLAEADDDTGTFMVGAAPPVPDRIGREFGRFRLLELLGVGGMGTVYRAERTDGVPQTVAVKVLRSAINSANRSHFAREARMLAGLEHPSIARLIDVGDQHGEAWIAMEFVQGQSITAHCDAECLDTPSRVRLLLAVADAVATAHRRLIVHRDIKPSNVLVTHEGQPKLIDFGIASALRQPGVSHEITMDVSQLFTPHYAAPEQVKGEPVTVATDVFGLGALAYRVLTGRELFKQANSAIGYLLAVTKNDVEMASQAALAAGMSPAQVRGLEGDLDSILMKALERDPARRYLSVEDLQNDLRAYLEGRPVKARSATLPYRMSKFVRRHTWGLGLSVLAGLGLLVAGAAYVVQERRVDQALHAAARRGEFLQSLLKSANPRGGKRDASVADLLDQAADQVAGEFSREPLVAVSMLDMIANTDFNLGRFPNGLQVSDRQIELLRRNNGSELDLAEALTIRGELLISSGEYAEAQIPLREALAHVDKRRGAERQLSLALDGLAKACQDLGNLGEAEALFQREIEVNATIGKPIGGEAGFPYAGLGALRYTQGRYAEGASYMAKALEIAKGVFLPDHPDHPDLLDAKYNYASLLEANRQAGEAEPIFRDLLETYRRVLGPQHYETYSAQQGLAHVLLALKRYQEAAEEAHQAAVGLTAIVGENERWSRKAWDVFGLATCLAGNAEEGLRVLHRVRELPLTREDSWLTMNSNIHIGICLVSQHRYSEAEPGLRSTVESWEKSHGDRDNTIQDGYHALADLYTAIGRPNEAAVWQSKILRDSK